MERINRKIVIRKKIINTTPEDRVKKKEKTELKIYSGGTVDCNQQNIIRTTHPLRRHMGYDLFRGQTPHSGAFPENYTEMKPRRSHLRNRCKWDGSEEGKGPDPRAKPFAAPSEDNILPIYKTAPTSKNVAQANLLPTRYPMNYTPHQSPQAYGVRPF